MQEQEYKINILIIGGGKGGYALFEALRKTAIVNIIAVIDSNPKAPALIAAKASGIATGFDYRPFLEDDRIDEIFEVTGNDEVHKEVLRLKAAHVNVISGHSAKLMWAFLNYHESVQLELQYAKEYTELLFNLTPSAVFCVDNNEVITMWNKKAEEMTGYTAEEVVGRKCFLFSGSSCKETCSLFDETVTKPVFNTECTIRIKNGQQRMLSKNIDLFRDKKGRIIGGIESFSDITQKRLAEQETQRLKDDFLNIISHELRTPLTTIREAVSQMYEGILGETTDTQKEFLSICLGDINRLMKIINSLLDISKLDAKKVELARTNSNIVELVRRAAASFILKAKERNIELRTQSSGEKIEAFIDEDKILQVFTNLIGNALKFTEKGYVEIKVQDKGGIVECVVSDTGPGIPAQELASIFDKFRQVGRSYGPGEKGTGLGLPITKKLVELHKGDIRVSSAPGKGTSFIFTLPKQISDEELLKERIERMIELAGTESREFVLFMITLQGYEKEKELSEQEKATVIDMVEGMIARSIVVSKKTIAKNARELLMVFESGAESIASLTENIRRTVKDVLFSCDDRYEINFSFGSVSFPYHEVTCENLLNKAYASLMKDSDIRIKKSICIVDDDAGVRSLFEDVLRNLGYTRIDTAASGTEALKKLEQSLYDMMIVDMVMPEMNGYELIGRMKENRRTKNIPILITSGYKVEFDRLSEYMKDKAIPVLGKPVNIEHVRRLVSFML